MQFLTRFVLDRRSKLALKTAFALGAAFSCLVDRPALAQVPETGVWINDQGKGAIEIKPCGAALCGNIVWLKEPLNDQGQPLFDRRNPDESKRNRPICGLPVIGNVKRTSEGWDEGWIYSPEEGAEYDVAIQASGDRLTVTGYKGIKLFSKTLTWTRAPADLPRCNGAPASQTKGPAGVPPTKLVAPPPGAKKPATAQGPPPSGTAAKVQGTTAKAATASPAKPGAAAPANQKPAANTATAKSATPAKTAAKTPPAGTSTKAATTKAATNAKPGQPVKEKTASTATVAPKPVPAQRPDATTAAADAAKKAAAVKKKAADEAEAASADQ